MWPDLEGVTIWICPGPTDRRKQIHGLAQIVERSMDQKPFSGDLFLFCGRTMTTLRALYWDRNGFCLWTKRLEQGRFPWPSAHPGTGKAATLSRAELAMILDGIDFRKRFTTLRYSCVS